MVKKLITNLGLGTVFLVSSMTTNAAWIQVASDTLTFDDDIVAQTSANWGSCTEGTCTSPPPTAPLLLPLPSKPAAASTSSPSPSPWP